jgi:hypothetical protein
MEPSVDQVQLDRRLKMAQMLREQAMQPDQQQMAGGYVLPYSPFQGLAKLAQGYVAGQMEKSADKQRQDMTTAKNAKMAEALKNYGKVTDTTSTADGMQDFQGKPLYTETPQTRAATPDEQMQQDWQLSQIDPSFSKILESRKAREDTQTARLEQIRLANELKKLQLGSDAKPFYQPLQTAQGVYAFNARTGKVEQVQGPEGGGAVVGAQYDPSLQGKIAGAKATGTETGKATGESISQLKDIDSMMPRFETLTKELSQLGKKATYTMAGQAADQVKRQLGMNVGDPAIARKEYISKVDNEILPLLRQTFGAAFTVKEGESLRATLGDPDSSPEEKDAILKTFLQSKKEQAMSLQRRTGGANQQSSAPSGGAKFLGFE